MAADRRHPISPVRLEGLPIGSQVGLGDGQHLGLGGQRNGLDVQSGRLGLAPSQLGLQADHQLPDRQGGPIPLDALEALC